MRSPFMVTLQAPVPVQASPHSVKRWPGWGMATTVTTVPASYVLATWVPLGLRRTPEPTLTALRL